MNGEAWWVDAFLLELRRTARGSRLNVTLAAERAGIYRELAYRSRRREGFQRLRQEWDLIALRLRAGEKLSHS